MTSSSATISPVHCPRSSRASGESPIHGGTIWLHSPISPTEGKPWIGASIPHTLEQAQGVTEHPHAFQPPREGDSRSPCPALNTLANHGYLPRNGHNITAQHLLAALRHPETYHLSGPLAKLLVYGGLFMVHDFNASSVSLHDLSQHDGIEHDASVVHQNTPAGNFFAPTRCDTGLLDKLLKDGDLTAEEVEMKRVELEKVSPLDGVHQEIARGEWALVLDVFGQAHGGRVPEDFLRVWLKENRFPEGWRPTHEQGLIGTMTKSSELRHGMKDYREQHVETAEDVREERVLLSELTVSSPTSGTMGEWRSSTIPILPVKM